MINVYVLIWNRRRYVCNDGAGLLAFAKYLGDPY